MLTENKSVRQRPEEGFRRWFTSADYDLILWFDNDEKTLKGFQLCYDKRKEEKAFTFEFATQGHHFVSKTERSSPGFGVIASGILRDDAGRLGDDLVRAVEREIRETAEIDDDLSAVILRALGQYNAAR